MALPALCLAALLSAATAVPYQNFYYQPAYQPAYQAAYTPAYQPAYQQVYQQAYQPAYQPAYQVAYHQQQQPYSQHLVPIPLAHQFIPAIPTHPIYSAGKAKSQQGYSYETEDVAGGHAQVIYVSGPNSQQIFQQSLKTLHFALPIYQAPTSNQTATATEEPATTTESEAVTETATEPSSTTTPASQNNGLPPIDYYRAEVLPPHTRIVVGELPLIAYSFLPHGLQSNIPAPKPNESLDKGSKAASRTEEPSAGKEETDAEKSEAATTLAPSSEESESSSSSDSSSNSSSNDNDNENSKAENSTEETESATETAEKNDS